MRFFRSTGILACVLALLIPAAGGVLRQQEVPNPAADLAGKLESGKIVLKYDEDRGYLSAILKVLDVPISSQTLVFSKSSFQLTQISPEYPRAIYFNDDVYVGWVSHAPALEIAAVDPKTGPVFYTLNQEDGLHPKMELQMEQCTICHDTFQTSEPVPRLLMLSVLPNRDGNALKRFALITNDQ